jgi:hypothetical protein
MRTLSSFVLALILVTASTTPLHAQTSPATVQSLFLGQRLCGDTTDICFVPVSLTGHRFLHVIVHSVPTDTDWRIQNSVSCSGPMQDVGGDAPVPDSGYLETVVDLTASTPALYQRAACFALRGREHYYVNFYAAYLDDSPAPDAAALYPGYQTLSGRPDLPDLDVAFIHRNPTYAYDAVPNAPRAGEAVTFTAHILNAGGLPEAASPYQWILDGHVVSTGMLPAALPAGGETTESWSWSWSPNPHTLTFHIFPTGSQISLANDSLSIQTDALSLGFWVERGAWQYFLDHQWQYCETLSCEGSVTLADWLERNVRVWNGMLANASYDYPDRVTVADRIRVDEIVIVPDGSLPLHGGLATNDPNTADHTVDLEWGLPAAGVDHAYRDANDGPFNVDVGLLHELGHARSLADLFRFDVQLDGDNVVSVLDASGRPAFDQTQPLDFTRPLHAFFNEVGALSLYSDAEADIMSCACTRWYSSYDALVLNRIRGRRATCGNVNAPCNLGDWFLDLPAVTRLRIVGAGGRLVQDGTRVRLFFDTGQGYGDHRFTQSESLTLTATAGEVTLPPDPFHTAGDQSRAGHNLLLIETVAPGRDAFCFLEPATLNIADWLGYGDRAHPAVMTLDLRRISRNACNFRLPAPRVNDPFGTSPSASSAEMTNSGSSHSVTVRLSDGAASAQPMRNRLVRLVAADGKVLGQAVTGPNGTVHLRVRSRPARVIDITDNALVIPLASTATPPRAARRR